jgi:predicted peroxiredoxin
MRVLYFITRGANDPTGASLPLHLATNGSLAVGHHVSVVLAGDGADLARRATREEVHGVGLPQLRELFAALVEHQVPVYVWQRCGVARGVTDEDLADFNGAWAGPQDAAALIAECDRTVTF